MKVQIYFAQFRFILVLEKGFSWNNGDVAEFMITEIWRM